MTVKRIAEYAGASPLLRSAFITTLRILARFQLSEKWRDEVHWPLVQALLTGGRTQVVKLKNGLVFEVTAASRIEKNLLLSPDLHPDHVWEPFTTKLLLELASGNKTVLVCGAYIGDQALLIAKQGAAVYAFEPMSLSFKQLTRNRDLNNLSQVCLEQKAVWSESGKMLALHGSPALAACSEVEEKVKEAEETCIATTIDDYLREKHLTGVDIISMDLEGGELAALQGAREQLCKPQGEAPSVVFELHRSYVDWSQGVQNTSIVSYLEGFGYTIYGIRDYQHCYPMQESIITLIPVSLITTEGPPHGFNLLATKDPEQLRSPAFRIVEGGTVRDLSPKLLLRELFASLNQHD